MTTERLHRACDDCSFSNNSILTYPEEGSVDPPSENSVNDDGPTSGYLNLDFYEPYVDKARAFFVPSLERKIRCLLENCMYKNTDWLGNWRVERPLDEELEEAAIDKALKCLIAEGLDGFVNSLGPHNRVRRICREIDAIGLEGNLLRGFNVWNYIHEKDFWHWDDRESSTSSPIPDTGSDLEVEYDSEGDPVSCRRVHRNEMLDEESKKRTENDPEEPRCSRRDEPTRVVCSKKPRLTWKNELKLVIRKSTIKSYGIHSSPRMVRIERLSLPCETSELIERISRADPPLSELCLIAMRSKFTDGMRNVCSCVNDILGRTNRASIRRLRLSCEIRPGYVNFKLNHRGAGGSPNRCLLPARVAVCQTVRRRGSMPEESPAPETRDDSSLVNGTAGQRETVGVIDRVGGGIVRRNDGERAVGRESTRGPIIDDRGCDCTDPESHSTSLEPSTGDPERSNYRTKDEPVAAGSRACGNSSATKKIRPRRVPSSGSSSKDPCRIFRKSGKRRAPETKSNRREIVVRRTVRRKRRPAISTDLSVDRSEISIEWPSRPRRKLKIRPIRLERCRRDSDIPGSPRIPRGTRRNLDEGKNRNETTMSSLGSIAGSIRKIKRLIRRKIVSVFSREKRSDGRREEREESRVERTSGDVCRDESENFGDVSESLRSRGRRGRLVRDPRRRLACGCDSSSYSQRVVDNEIRWGEFERAGRKRIFRPGGKRGETKQKDTERRRRSARSIFTPASSAKRDYTEDTRDSIDDFKFRRGSLGSTRTLRPDDIYEASITSLPRSRACKT